MSGEGLARVISAEWIRATATLIPVLLALWWVLKGQGLLWRHSVWAQIGADARQLEGELAGQLRVRWLGYELKSDSCRVRWLGGLSGPVTVIKTPSGSQRQPGWLSAEAVRALVATSTQ